MIENEIKVLSDREHIIKRSGMYIGSSAYEAHERFVFGEFKPVSYVPGVIKLIDEIIDNSVDEGIRTNFEFANKISVDIDDHKIVVTDNGRGLPQGNVITPDGKTIPGPVAAWTLPRAGGNFGDDKLRVTGGMNGVGSALTNFFSTMFKGVTSDGKNEITVNCSNGAENISHSVRKSTKKGTTVEFVPDFSHFEATGITETDRLIVRDRLQTLAVVFPGIEFKFNGTKLVGNFKKYAHMYDEAALIQESESTSLAIGRSADGFRHMTYVNNINPRVGGSHIDYVTNELASKLIPVIKRKYGIEITGARIRECLTIVMFVRGMKNMRFDGQTKERLTVPAGEIRDHMQLDIDKLAKALMKNEAVLMPIIEAALARKLAAEKAAETKATKKAAKAKVAKHIKPNKYGDDKLETTLFLTEGDSAIGYLIETRDRDLHGGYPLRGKFKTTWGEKPVDQLKNKEIFDICSITGLVHGEKAEGLNYKNIAIMTDADVDGTGSIYPSLVSFFTQWPELFEQNRIRFVKTPVIIATKKGKQEWFYDLPSFESKREELKGFDVRYIKGLGSLTREEYERVINEPNYEVVKLGENWKDKLEMLYGDNSAPRKVWMMA